MLDAEGLWAESMDDVQLHFMVHDLVLAADWQCRLHGYLGCWRWPPDVKRQAEGSEMGKLRREMHRRMLGNGYCARPVEMDCHFESICESCTFFVTTIEFRLTLERQRDDAAAKGQVAREQIFDGLLTRLDEQAS
ncbi:hypothetical protein OG625_00190 [Streptomyces sp. NBC_01351]|uniref:hypothetical protein n=1 Tax=Streptomyces sp. NBC_01351 TaxID=2903833 RepID=UPI002E30A9C1|nr:hypothetical protein [Streptomyces sp. NBC_01351]